MNATFIPRQVSTTGSLPRFSASRKEFNFQIKPAKIANAPICSKEEDSSLSWGDFWKARSPFFPILNEKIVFSTKLMKFDSRISSFLSLNWNWVGQRVSIQPIWEVELMISNSRVLRGRNAQSEHLKYFLFQNFSEFSGNNYQNLNFYDIFSEEKKMVSLSTDFQFGNLC